MFSCKQIPAYQSVHLFSKDDLVGYAEETLNNQSALWAQDFIAKSITHIVVIAQCRDLIINQLCQDWRGP